MHPKQTMKRSTTFISPLSFSPHLHHLEPNLEQHVKGAYQLFVNKPLYALFSPIKGHPRKLRTSSGRGNFPLPNDVVGMRESLQVGEKRVYKVLFTKS